MYKTFTMDKSNQAKPPKPLTFKDYLDQKGESILAFSKRSGISYATCWRVYNGKTNPRGSIASIFEEHTGRMVLKENLVSW